MECPIDELKQEYLRISAQHWEAERHFFARVVLGPSVVRVFNSGTKPELMNSLVEIDIDAMAGITSQAQFKAFFESQLVRLARVIRATNRDNPRVNPGYKWGHATKILCLYLRDLVLHSHYFSDRVSKRLRKYLYVPVDNIVIKRLKNNLGCEMPFRSIKDINTKAMFYDVQDMLGKAATRANVPRIWFDDNWGIRI